MKGEGRETFIPTTTTTTLSSRIGITLQSVETNGSLEEWMDYTHRDEKKAKKNNKKKKKEFKGNSSFLLYSISFRIGFDVIRLIMIGYYVILYYLLSYSYSLSFAHVVVPIFLRLFVFLFILQDILGWKVIGSCPDWRKHLFQTFITHQVSEVEYGAKGRFIPPNLGNYLINLISNPSK